MAHAPLSNKPNKRTLHSFPRNKKGVNFVIYTYKVTPYVCLIYRKESVLKLLRLLYRFPDNLRIRKNKQTLLECNSEFVCFWTVNLKEDVVLSFIHYFCFFACLLACLLACLFIYLFICFYSAFRFACFCFYLFFFCDTTHNHSTCWKVTFV